MWTRVVANARRRVSGIDDGITETWHLAPTGLAAITVALCHCRTVKFEDEAPSLAVRIDRIEAENSLAFALLALPT